MNCCEAATLIIYGYLENDLSLGREEIAEKVGLFFKASKSSLVQEPTCQRKRFDKSVLQFGT